MCFYGSPYPNCLNQLFTSHSTSIKIFFNPNTCGLPHVVYRPPGLYNPTPKACHLLALVYSVLELVITLVVPEHRALVSPILFSHLFPFTKIRQHCSIGWVLSPSHTVLSLGYRPYTLSICVCPNNPVPLGPPNFPQSPYFRPTCDTVKLLPLLSTVLDFCQLSVNCYLFSTVPVNCI